MNRRRFLPHLATMAGLGVLPTVLAAPRTVRVAALQMTPQLGMPPQMPEARKTAWERWLTRGNDYYETVTHPYLASGEIPEYLPLYMRD